MKIESCVISTCVLLLRVTRTSLTCTSSVLHRTLASVDFDYIAVCSVGITEDDIETYYELWGTYDPKATKYIPANKLSDFVDELEAPLHIPKPNFIRLVMTDIPVCDGDRIHCRDILDVLTKLFLKQGQCNLAVKEYSGIKHEVLKCGWLHKNTTAVAFCISVIVPEIPSDPATVTSEP